MDVWTHLHLFAIAVITKDDCGQFGLNGCCWNMNNWQSGLSLEIGVFSIETNRNGLFGFYGTVFLDFVGLVSVIAELEFRGLIPGQRMSLRFFWRLDLCPLDGNNLATY